MSEIHPRAAIRKAIADRLKSWRIEPAGGEPGERWTMAEDRIFDSRLRPIDERKDLPAALVYARKEKVDLDSYPRSGEDGDNVRTLDMAVEAVVRAGDDVDDDLDKFARQVEAALEWLEIPGLETATIRLSATDIEVTTDGRTPIGAARLIFTVTYRAPWRRVPPVCEPPGEVWLARAPDIGAANVGSYERVAPP
jgi:hypothetical protein